MTGYPYFNENNNDIEDEKTRLKIENVKQYVKKFSEDNNITVKGSSEISKQLNVIIKAFPEFLTEIEKAQHEGHAYTLDIHSLKVLQNVINNPKYEQLSKEDKTILKISALFHDLTKKEGQKDKIHPLESSFDVYHILDKLKMNENDKYKIYNIIKNHDWLERYNTSDNKDIKEKIIKDTAFDLRKGKLGEMEFILTESDMRSVSNNFFEGFKNAFDNGKSEIEKTIKNIKKTALCLPQTKIPKADEIKIDGVNTKKKVTKTKEGKYIENTYVYIKKGLDLSEYGFEQGLISDDINVLVHGIAEKENSLIFQNIGQLDSNAVLSSSYTNFGKGFHAFKNNGFILDIDCDDILAGYYENFISGEKKNVDLFKSRYLFGDKVSKHRNYISDVIKKGLNLSDEEYINLYEEIGNKSITQIEKSHPDAAKVLKQTIMNLPKGQSVYNEILVTRPKIQAVFNYKTNEIIPDYLLEYASENNLPVIIFCNK